MNISQPKLRSEKFDNNNNNNNNNNHLRDNDLFSYSLSYTRQRLPEPQACNSLPIVMRTQEHNLTLGRYLLNYPRRNATTASQCNLPLQHSILNLSLLSRHKTTLPFIQRLPHQTTDIPTTSTKINFVAAGQPPYLAGSNYVFSDEPLTETTAIT